MVQRCWWRTLEHSKQAVLVTVIYKMDSITTSFLGSSFTEGFFSPRGSIPDGGRGFFLYPQRPAGSGAHPASCTVGTGIFPGVNAAGSAANHSPPSSVDVKKE
jgi:hypothetical protein